MRQHCPAMPTDHYLAPDIAHAFDLVNRGELSQLAQSVGGLVVLR